MMEEEASPKGAASRGVVSAVLGLGWVIWALLFWFFWSEDHEVSRRMAILLMSLLVMAAAMSTIWIPWSMRFPPEAGYAWWMPGFSWRVAASAVIAVGLFLLTIYWLWFQGEGYTLCQSCVVIIVVLLVTGGVMTALWARWGMRQGTKATVDVAEEVVEGVVKALDEVEGEMKQTDEEGPSSED